jgi:hypothetical protein
MHRVESECCHPVFLAQYEVPQSMCGELVGFGHPNAPSRLNRCPAPSKPSVASEDLETVRSCHEVADKFHASIDEFFQELHQDDVERARAGRLPWRCLTA